MSIGTMFQIFGVKYFEDRKPEAVGYIGLNSKSVFERKAYLIFLRLNNFDITWFDKLCLTLYNSIDNNRIFIW